MIPDSVKRVLAIIGLLVVGVVVWGLFDRSGSERDSSSPALADTVRHPSTNPVEERIIENLEWKWVKRPVCEIEGCWQLELVAPPGGCPNGVYGELWILDENETVIDSSIDKLARGRPEGASRVQLPRGRARRGSAFNQAELPCEPSVKLADDDDLERGLPHHSTSRRSRPADNLDPSEPED